MPVWPASGPPSTHRGGHFFVNGPSAADSKKPKGASATSDGIKGVTRASWLEAEGKSDGREAFGRREAKSRTEASDTQLGPGAPAVTRSVHGADALIDLRLPPGNRLEKLHGDRAGQYSIRINDQYRICFEWRGGDAHNVEMTDYH